MKKTKAEAPKAAHSKIGASSMYRWAECPGSVKLCEGVPNQQSSYAEEGSRAHALAELILQRELFGKKLSKEDQLTVAQADTEMSDAVWVYVNFVLDRAKGMGEVLIEHKFDLSELHPGLFGTADCVIYDPKKKHLLVADYKHGAGISVSPVENSQLMYYGLGALLTLGYPCATVELAIAQPRCPHSEGMIRSWTIPSMELMEFSANLVDFAKATEDPFAPLKTGDQCRFCPAAGICPKLHETALQTAKNEFTPVVAASYSPEKLGETLNLLDRIEGYCKSVREFAYQEAMAGRMPKGWKLVQKRGSRKWIYEDDALVVDALKDLGFADADIFEKPSVKTPPQFEKLLKNKQERDEVLGVLVKSVSSGATLVPESDPRPNLVTLPEDHFTKITEG